jgi:chorismate dehydratase
LDKIKVGAVSYLNTKPLLYGIKQGLVANEIDLVEAYPAEVARLLLDDAIDVGLVPVAIIPLLQEAHIITDYCIATDGNVASVCLFSRVPMDQITTVLLDYQSRTSVNLVKILLKHYWKKEVVLVNTNADFSTQIVGTTAGVVIGDRAFDQYQMNTYVYDLGLAWKEFTGLPFVFAAWVANKQLSKNFIQLFNLIKNLSSQIFKKWESYRFIIISVVIDYSILV